jgi:hypothetical protein
MGKLIFLDFDGVLRRETSPQYSFDQDCLENFESAMRHCAISKIVISSTWRLAFSLNELRSKFSSDVAGRIVGKTPETLEEETYERYAEIMAYLEERNITAMPWVAIDDSPAHFPKRSPVIFTDPQKGFDAECANQLVRILLAPTKTTR